MFELLVLFALLVLGVLVLKVIFGVLGFAFHLLLLPLKLLFGVVAVIVALPFLILALPVLLVLGLGFAVVGATLCSIFCFFWAF